VAGFIANFTLSFGIGIVLSLPVFLLINFIKGIVQERSDRKLCLNLHHALFYSIGVILAFAPFLLFEFRHNFCNQQLF
jgi:Sec-independent protein secretion pathway component TatC